MLPLAKQAARSTAWASVCLALACSAEPASPVAAPNVTAPVTASVVAPIAPTPVAIKAATSAGAEPTLDRMGAADDAPMLQAIDMDTTKARSVLASVPALAKYAADFTLQTERDTDAALIRGKRSRSNITLWTFAPPAFAWSPVRGELLWGLTGRSGEHSLFVLLYPLRNGTFAHAASTVLDEKASSIAVGYNESYRAQLTWTSCFDCPGESGIVVRSDDGHVALSYR